MKYKTTSSKRKRQNILIILLLFLIILSISLIIFYFKNQFKEQKIKSVTPSKEPIKKDIQIVNENSNKRPIAIMIDNNIGNELHAGLQESYINYEIIVEGGLTRIMALFKDKDIDLIGPVRSARHYFLDYALESDAIYAHFGWSPYAQNDINFLNVNNINGLYDSSAFWRDNKISAPHNVFTSIEKIYSFAQKKNYSLESNNWNLLNYTADEVNLDKKYPEAVGEGSSSSIVANDIKIDYSYNQSRTYQYDNLKKVYLRFMNNIPHLDKTTNEQLYYKNIIIEKVNNTTLDQEGRQDLDTVGKGEGYYITNGYAIPIEWSKSSRNSKTIYKDKNGIELEINDGNTFINIVPLFNKIIIE